MNLEEYEKEGRALYADFSEAVRTIVAAAIKDAGQYKLQQVQSRAKSVDSLTLKMIDKNLPPESDVTELKDLAGCRAIFYTNTDVDRFFNSGIVEENFEIVARKLHHPDHQTDDATELYMANHYVVKLTDARAGLPEYRRFAGLKCELQVQTILNHSWAASAHDTIYKAPDLQNFGTRALDSIKQRLVRIAKKYLTPAGYEFDRVFHDFQRLKQGKALLDDNALEAVVNARDNNERMNALNTFADNVLPLYDDIQGIYPDVLRKLVEAAQAAKKTVTKPRETPFGTLPATTFADVLQKITRVLGGRPYRYVNVNLTFAAIRELWLTTSADEERKAVYELAEKVSKHDLHVRQKYGAAVQEMLVDDIARLPLAERLATAPLLARILKQVLKTEVEGITNTSSVMTIHRATTAASPSLEALRNRAIDLLEEMYSADLERVPRGDVEDALMTACWVPIQSGYSNDLARLIVRDSIRVLTIFAGRAGTLPFDDRQSLEADVNQVYRMNSSLPPGFDNDETLKDLQSQVRDAALAFREAANADDEFELYKLLVGFKSVYPGSWEANPPDWKADAEYRELQVQRLLETVRPDDSDLWFNRLDSFAATESNDLATFPVLADFVRKLAQQEPAMVLDWVSRGESRLHRFLPGMLSGLMNSNRREDAINLIDKWIRAGDKLSDIAWYLRFADEFDERMLRRTLERAIDKHELAPIRNSLDAAVRQYDKNPGTLIESVFIPAIAALKELNPENWLVSLFTPWMDAPILMALNEEQATAVLDALIAQSRLEYDAEYVVAAVARRWPKRVLEFLSKRQVFKRSPEASQYYDAIPFQAHALREPLMTEPALVLDAAREWFHESPDLFQYDGGVLIASIFPDIDGEFAARMNQMAIEEPLFVLGVLSSYEGKRVIYPFVRQIVAAAEPGSEVLSHAQDALEQSGVVVGEFGFANLSRERQKLITPWLEDDNEVVRDFAKERIAYLERRIAAEVKRAEAGIAARKLDFGEDITETGDEDRDDSNDGDMEEEPHSD